MFFIADKLIIANQHGFLPNNKSWVTYVIERYDLITDSLDIEQSVNVI